MDIDTTNEVDRMLSVSPSESSDEPLNGEECDVASPIATPDILGITRERRPSSHSRKRKTIYTAGRPPWYNKGGEQTQAFVIGLSGGSASGKTTVAAEVIQSLRVPWVSLLSMDSFYKVLNPEQNKLANESNYDFDIPEAFDYDLLISTLRKLKEGKSVQVPVYDFSTHSRAKYTKAMYGADVVIFEGILAFTNPELLSLMDLKIFVDTDSDVRLARRLKRDIVERGRDLEGVLKQYNRFVKPSFHQFIEPSMKYADIVVPRGAENKVALKLIVHHIKDRLKKQGCKIRSKLINEKLEGDELPESFHLLPNKSQVRGMHTVIRNKETKRDDFVFYTNRLACLVIEYALSFLPFKDTVVSTPQGTPYSGKKFDGKVCGVAILRAGEVLEPALQSVLKDATIGKILIQTNQMSGEPELHFLRLPTNIADCHVLLMDATVATGAAAIMAIRILLDHDVPQDHILLVSLLSARLGIHSVAYAFPDVKLITSAMDEVVNEDYHIIPGVGNYGDRYFGTEAEGVIP